MSKIDIASHGAHRHDDDVRCEQCGNAMKIERSYKIDDRFLRALVAGLASDVGIDAFTKGRKKGTIYVASTDVILLDRFDARLRELAPRLDAELLTLATRFIREHTGTEIKTPAT